MNPMEQICKQIGSMGFRNELFKTYSDVIDSLCDTIKSITYSDCLYISLIEISIREDKIV